MPEPPGDGARAVVRALVDSDDRLTMLGRTLGQLPEFPYPDPAAVANASDDARALSLRAAVRAGLLAETAAAAAARSGVAVPPSTLPEWTQPGREDAEFARARYAMANGRQYGPYGRDRLTGILPAGFAQASEPLVLAYDDLRALDGPDRLRGLTASWPHLVTSMGTDATRSLAVYETVAPSFGRDPRLAPQDRDLFAPRLRWAADAADPPHRASPDDAAFVLDKLTTAEADLRIIGAVLDQFGRLPYQRRPDDSLQFHLSDLPAQAAMALGRAEQIAAKRAAVAARYDVEPPEPSLPDWMDPRVDDAPFGRAEHQMRMGAPHQPYGADRLPRVGPEAFGRVGEALRAAYEAAGAADDQVLAGVVDDVPWFVSGLAEDGVRTMGSAQALAPHLRAMGSPAMNPLPLGRMRGWSADARAAATVPVEVRSLGGGVAGGGRPEAATRWTPAVTRRAGGRPNRP